MAEKITLYSTGCPKCGALKKKLEMKSIPYTEVTNIDEMVRLGMKSAPNLMVDGELLDFSHAIAWVNSQ